MKHFLLEIWFFHKETTQLSDTDFTLIINAPINN